ncbi:hypothetical protein [Streptomyces prunicolor]
MSGSFADWAALSAAWVCARSGADAAACVGAAATARLATAVVV